MRLYRTVPILLLFLFIPFSVFASRSAFAQSTQSKTISDIQFSIRAPYLHHAHASYGWKLNSPGTSEIRSDEFDLTWQAEAPQGYISYGVKATKGTFANQLKIKLDGELDTDGTAPSWIQGNQLNHDFPSPTIYIPYLEDAPKISVTVDFDLNIDANNSVTPYTDKYGNNAYLYTTSSGKLWLIQLDNSFEYNPKDAQKTNSPASRSFRHSVSADIVKMYPYNPSTDAIPLLDIYSFTTTQGERYTCYYLKIYKLIEKLMERNKEMLQSDPPQTRYDAWGSTLIELGGSTPTIIRETGKKHTRAQVKAHGTITIEVRYDTLHRKKIDDIIDTVDKATAVLALIPAGWGAKTGIAIGIARVRAIARVGKAVNRTLITIREDKAPHIFRNEKEHFQKDTPANRKILEDVANNPKNYIDRDKRGNDWYLQKRADGKYIWVEVRGNEIRNGGISDAPRKFNPDTGLKSPIKPSQKKTSYLMNLDEKVAYSAMVYFLEKFYEETSSDDVGALLGELDISITDGLPMDIANWDAWLECINKAQEHPLPLRDDVPTS